MTSLKHLHLGPGKLGLGLVIATTRACGFEVHLVTRADTRLTYDATFTVVELDERGEPRDKPTPLSIASFSRADHVSSLHTGAKSIIADAADLLLTTAVKTCGLSACRGMLLEIASLRRRENADAGTVFIAAENDPGEQFPQLLTDMRERGVDCRETVVDRLCVDPAEQDDAADAEPAGDPAPIRSRTIHADALVEWLIQGEPSTPSLAALDTVAHVTFVGNISPYERRKRWLVNGCHLALALVARARNQPRMDLAAVAEERNRWLAALRSQLSILLEEDFDPESLEAYGRAHVRVWIRNPDPEEKENMRVVRRFKRHTLPQFLRDLERKLAEPARASVKHGGCLSPELRRVFDALHELLMDIEQYVDYDKNRPGEVTFSSETDARVLDQYAALLSGLFEEEEIEDRKRWLGRAFKVHRAAYDAA